MFQSRSISLPNQTFSSARTTFLPLLVRPPQQPLQRTFFTFAQISGLKPSFTLRMHRFLALLSHSLPIVLHFLTPLFRNRTNKSPLPSTSANCQSELNSFSLLVERYTSHFPRSYLSDKPVSFNTSDISLVTFTTTLTISFVCYHYHHTRLPTENDTHNDQNSPTGTRPVTKTAPTAPNDRYSSLCFYIQHISLLHFEYHVKLLQWRRRINRSFPVRKKSPETNSRQVFHSLLLVQHFFFKQILASSEPQLTSTSKGLATTTSPQISSTSSSSTPSMSLPRLCTSSPYSPVIPN